MAPPGPPLPAALHWPSILALTSPWPSLRPSTLGPSFTALYPWPSPGPLSWPPPWPYPSLLPPGSSSSLLSLALGPHSRPSTRGPPLALPWPSVLAILLALYPAPPLALPLSPSPGKFELPPSPREVRAPSNLALLCTAPALPCTSSPFLRPLSWPSFLALILGPHSRPSFLALYPLALYS